MGPRLVGRGGSDLDIEIPPGRSTLGRDPGADIVLHSPHVSGRHALVRRDGGLLELTDLGSTNGTVLNGRRVQRAPVRIADGDRLVLADVELAVVIDDATTAMPVVTERPGRAHSSPIADVEAAWSAGPTRPPDSRSNDTAGRGVSGRGRAPVRSGRQRRVFISYSRDDSRHAEQLASGLRDRGWDVSVDTEILRPGERWTEGLAEHVRSSHAVVVLVSPSSSASPWVQKELIAATNAGRPILPVVVDPTHLDELQARFALVADTQWHILDEAAALEGSAVDDIADHLERLTGAARRAHRRSVRERLGTALLWLGVATTLASLGYLATRFAEVGGSFVEYIEALTASSTSESQITESFRQVAREQVSLLPLFGLQLVGPVVAISGWLLRRKERKRRLLRGGGR